MRIFRLFIIFLLISGLHEQISFGQSINHWETVFYSNSTFSYKTSSEGIPSSDWRNPDFDDSAWKTGTGGIGYGDGDDGTVVSSCISLCLRKSFQIIDTSLIVEALLNIDYDDAFVAYLNGVEIARNGLSGDFPSYNQSSSINHEARMYSGGVPESFLIPRDIMKTNLVEGNNILAVQVHNTDLFSSDLSSNVFFSVGLSSSDKQYLNNPPWFEPPFIYTSSKLPIIIIDTDGQTIPDEPKITAQMKIIYNGEGVLNNIDDVPNEYDGYIGIEVRGASSSGYPQKPWSLETRDALGENNNVSLLGMPKENDWVLLSHYNEKSFMRNPLSFHLFTKMGHYATRTRLCDVILNGKYEGIYLFGEKVKRDGDRIDIAKLDLDDNLGDSLTGGYIFKTEYYSSADTWLSDYSPVHHPTYNTHFAYYYPKYDEITDPQKFYIKSAVDQFQQIMHQSDFAEHYNNYIDLSSFIDYFIISEVSRNVDGYKKSRYLFKDKDSKGGLIHSGPPWDFDWAWKNIYDCTMFRATDGSGWSYKINDCLSNPSPGWMTRLLEDPEFENQLKCRYTQLRETILSDESIDLFMDSIYNHVYDAQINHYKRWEILGTGTGAPEVEAPSLSYDQEVEKLRNWIDIRLTWLDANMPGSADNCDPPASLLDTDENYIFRMFPNPATTELYIESNYEISHIEIIDLTGKKVYDNVPGRTYSVFMNISHIQSGLYVVRIRTVDDKVKISKLIIN